MNIFKILYIEDKPAKINWYTVIKYALGTVAIGLFSIVCWEVFR